MTEQECRDVLFGRRPPRTAEERSYLRYMGGIQEEPPVKRIACQKCNRPFDTAGFVFPSGKAIYQRVCPDCISRLSKVDKPTRKTEARNPYRD